MTPSRPAKLAEIERMIQTARMHWASGLSPDTEDEQKARIALLEAIAEGLRRPAVTREQIEDILERQQVDSVTAEDGSSRILGIATTAEAIMALIGRPDATPTKRDVNLPLRTYEELMGDRYGNVPDETLRRGTRAVPARDRVSEEEARVSVALAGGCEAVLGNGGCLALNQGLACDCLAAARAVLALLEGK